MRRLFPSAIAVQGGHLPVVEEDILRQPAQPASLAEALELVPLLEDTLVRLGGCIGLAAPQIGISRQVAVVRHLAHPKHSNRWLVEVDLINPKHRLSEEPWRSMWEGCMSFPARRWNVPRFLHFSLDTQVIWPPRHPSSPPAFVAAGAAAPYLAAQSLCLQADREPVEYGGIVAAAVQHEYDHLQGVCLPWKEGAEECEKTVVVRKAAKVGRNQPCPCGSGRKFKRCCGANG
jgi:peptide deformylase